MVEYEDFGTRFSAELVAKIIGGLSSGLLLIGLARLLQPDGYGLLFLAISILGILQLASRLGIAKSTARYIAEYRSTDPPQIPHIVNTGVILNLLAIASVAFPLLLGHGLLADLIGEPALVPYLLVGVGYVVAGTLTYFVRTLLQGFEAIEWAAGVYILHRGSRLLFAVGIVLLGYGGVGALVGYVLANVLATVFGLTVLVTFYRRQGSAQNIEAGLRRRIGEYAVPLTATRAASVLDSRVDKVLIGFFLTPASVGFYTIAAQLVEFVTILSSALGFTLSPTLGTTVAGGNRQKASRLFEETLTYSLLVYVPLGAGLALVANPLIELLFGAEYLDAVPVLRLFGAYVVFRSITKLTSNALNFLGRAREIAVAKGITAVLNVGLNVLLIPTLGIVGAALAMVCTFGGYTATTLYIMQDELNLRAGYLATRVGKILLITGTMSLVVYGLLDFVTGAITLGIVATSGIFVWFTLAVAGNMIQASQIRNVLPSRDRKE